MDLKNINVIYVSPSKEDKIFRINLFKVWEKDLEESILQAYLAEGDFQRFMETLREVFQITKEEHDIFKYGDSAFYANMKM